MDRDKASVPTVSILGEDVCSLLQMGWWRCSWGAAVGPWHVVEAAEGEGIPQESISGEEGH